MEVVKITLRPLYHPRNESPVLIVQEDGLGTTAVVDALQERKIPATEILNKSSVDISVLLESHAAVPRWHLATGVLGRSVSPVFEGPAGP
jgi:hypothetical protein